MYRFDPDIVEKTLISGFYKSNDNTFLSYDLIKNSDVLTQMSKDKKMRERERAEMKVLDAAKANQIAALNAAVKFEIKGEINLIEFNRQHKLYNIYIIFYQLHFIYYMIYNC